MEYRIKTINSDFIITKKNQKYVNKVIKMCNEFIINGSLHIVDEGEKFSFNGNIKVIKSLHNYGILKCINVEIGDFIFNYGDIECNNIKINNDLFNYNNIKCNSIIVRDSLENYTTGNIECNNIIFGISFSNYNNIKCKYIKNSK